MFNMPHAKPFDFDDLLPQTKRVTEAANSPNKAKISSVDLSVSIDKKVTAAKSKKSVKGLLALLKKSPVTPTKRGGITAEISHDRDHGYA